VFDSLLADIRDRERRFTVYRSGGRTSLEDRLATHNADIASRELPSDGPGPFLVLEKDGEFVGAIGLNEVERFLDPSIVRPGERDGVSEGYRALFDLLDETVFTAMKRRQLLAVSREIEERAYRVGTGTLHVSFQTLSTFESQTAVYRHLAAETELDIHVHGVTDWTPPEIEGITYHGYTGDSIGRYWVLAFAGGGETTQTSGLVAQEHSEGYSGFWTDDAEIVADILSELARA